MRTAPPLPPEVKRRGRLFQVLSGLGLSAAVIFLLLANLVLFLLANYFVATPQQLYHRTWETTAQHIFDPAALGDWQQWEHKYDGQIQTDEDAVKYANEALKSIKDRYTYLMDAEQVAAEQERSEGHFTGVGMVFGVKLDANGEPIKAADGKPLPDITEDGYPVVKQVINGGPAQKAGLKVGDAITTINGKDTRGMSLDQLITQVRGEAGTTVTFEIRHRDGQAEKLVITRAQIVVPAVTTKKLANGIGYLRLEGFDQFDATDEFKAGLIELKDSKALIIDLRGNPGGFVHNAINISSLFIEQGTVVSIKHRIPGDYKNPQYQTQVVKLTPTQLVGETTRTDRSGTNSSTEERQPYLSAGRPVVILVNNNSASASEMFTGALKDNGAATVVGTRTFGKGIGQSSIPMPNGTQLHITSLRYYTPNGTWLGDGGNSQSHGIEPDVVVEPNQDLEFGSDNDNQLQKAIEILSNKVGGGSSVPFFLRSRMSCAA